MLARARLAIVGIGEVPNGRYPDRSVDDIAFEVARMAIEDAGLRKDDIEAVLPAAAMMDNDFNMKMFFGRLPEEMGLKGCRFNAVSVAGGASSKALLKTAEGLISSGTAKTVLIVHAQQFSKFSVEDQIRFFSKTGMHEEWEQPYGMTYNALAALVAQRFMYERKVTREQVASVCVALRKWAELNPNAMFRKPLTIEEVLASREVASPLTAFMCNVLADGGSAFIVTSAEMAKEITDTPVYIIGEGSTFSHSSIITCPDIVKMRWREAAEAALEEAGIGIEDIDIAEIYAAYPHFHLIMLEEFGFCEPGTAGRFVMEGHTWPGGKLPMTTNGEALSQGHTGTGVGIALLVESARQLMGKAGERQVPGAEFVFYDCAGGAYMDCHISILAREVPRR